MRITILPMDDGDEPLTIDTHAVVEEFLAEYDWSWSLDNAFRQFIMERYDRYWLDEELHVLKDRLKWKVRQAVYGMSL